MQNGDQLALCLAIKAIDQNNIPHENKAYILMTLNSEEAPWQLSQEVVDLLSEGYLAYQFGFDYLNYKFMFNGEKELRAALNALLEIRI